MEIPQIRVYPIGDFYRWNQRTELALNPEFQRRSVWLVKARSYLLDTILRGFPVPLIFMREKLDLTRMSTVREVVDGQQRIKAILDFIDGNLTVLPVHNEDFGGVKFEELPEEARRTFLSYQMPVIVLPGATDGEVLEVFSRLNRYSERLTPQELLNAEFTGAFKTAVYRLGWNHLEFWRRHSIISNRAIMRMAEAELASEFVVAMLDGLQDKKKILKEFYERYDDEFPAGERVVREFAATLAQIGGIAGDTRLPRAFRRRTLFYSLFCVVYDALYGMPQSPTNPEGRKYVLPSESAPRVRERLERLSALVYSQTPDPSFVPFVEATARQTDNIGPRRTRHEVLWQQLRDLFVPAGSP